LVLPLPAASPAKPSLAERRAWSGIGVGVALAILPAAGGATLFSATDDIEPKRAGIYLLCSGIALAPIASHLIAREWRRAAYFGAVPLAATLGMVALVQLRPDVLLDGDVPTRVLFAVLISVDVLAATVGLADSLGAAERARRRNTPTLTLLPTLSPRSAGLALGGQF
jgi:hypothetical protein